jgi:hypothetical protein
MRRVARVVALALSLLGASGCSLHRGRSPVPGTHEGEWGTLRDLATRRALLYDGFDHRATATATHLSRAVREARAQRLAQWKSWTAEELQHQLELERAEAAKGEDFLLAFYTSDYRANDLDAVGSAWRIAVRTPGAEARAMDVDALDAKDPQLAMLFPWIGPFDTVYLVRFPPTSGVVFGEGGYAVELASALGKLELDWEQPATPTPLLLPAPPERR